MRPMRRGDARHHDVNNARLSATCDLSSPIACSLCLFRIAGNWRRLRAIGCTDLVDNKIFANSYYIEVRHRRCAKAGLSLERIPSRAVQDLSKIALRAVARSWV